MTALYRVRPGGLWRSKAVLQMLDETDGATWRDVRFDTRIGLFTAVRVRYWQAIEEKLARNAEQAQKRQAQRNAKRPADFKASKFTDTRMPTS